VTGEPDRPKKETIRIELPVRETGGPPISSPHSPDIISDGDDVSSANSFAPPKTPSGSPALSASVRPSSVPAAPGLKEETVRISLMPEPLHSSQKKTQPLIAMPQTAAPNPAVSAVPAEKSPMALYWMLLGVSALILIIQIWIYFS
jgi:hypothetical protein